MLQKYLKLNGITIKTIAEDTGFGYHAIQKTVNGNREGRAVRQAISAYLSLPYEHIWGTESDRHLSNHIRKNIELRLETQRCHLTRRYLKKDSRTVPDTESISNS